MCAASSSDQTRAFDIMTPFVHMLPSSASIQNAIDLMYEKTVSSVIIFHETDQMYYIVTHRDLINYFHHHTLENLQLDTIPLTEIMNGPITILEKETPIDAVINFIFEHGYKRIVIGNNGSPVGVISVQNIMLWNNMYFKPAKPLLFFIMVNDSGLVLGKYVWEENLTSTLDHELIDLVGGALSSISSITEEVLKESGNLRQLQKDNYIIMFEHRPKITGILFIDNNSVDLRRRLHDATDLFWEKYHDQFLGNHIGFEVEDFDMNEIAAMIFQRASKSENADDLLKEE